MTFPIINSSTFVSVLISLKTTSWTFFSDKEKFQMFLFTPCIEPCKTKSSVSLIQIYYTNFIFILTLTDTGRMNQLLTTEVQCASQDLDIQARKCMIFFPLFATLSLLSARYQNKLRHHLLTLKHYPVSQYWKNRNYHKSCLHGHDKCARMPETQISVCVWSPCVFTWDLRSYWLCSAQDNMRQILPTWCAVTTTLHLWRL